MKLPVILTILLGLGASLHAEVPSTLNYQGRVLQNGQPFEGTGHFVFGIYEGSTLLWTNKLPVPSPLNDPAAAIDSSDAKALTVRNGVFTVRLGEGDANNAPVGTDVFFKFDGTQRVRADVKLKVWFSPTTEGPYTKLEPDITFASVPFAQVAAVAETVGNLSVNVAHISDGAVTAQKLEAPVAQALVPPGTILPFGGQTAPPGYLLCDGTTYAAATYPALSSTLNNAFGGDANNFRVPDLRGRFLRGWDNGAGRDPEVAGRGAMNPGGLAGNNIGSLQGFATARPVTSPFLTNEAGWHQHEMHFYNGVNRFTLGRMSQIGNTNNGPVETGLSPGAGSHTHSIATGGDSETRPVNAYVNYIIKH